jgi:hypothetical protein
VRAYNCVCDLKSLTKGPSRLDLGLIGTQRQAPELTLGPIPAANTGPLPFNRIQSMVVTSPFTGHNTLRRHLYIMGLMDSPFVGGVEHGR